MNVWIFPSRIARIAGAVSSRLLDIAYPAVCPVCDTFYERGETGFCGPCSTALTALEGEAFCPRCARPTATAGAPCPWCAGRGLHPYEQVVRLGEYEEPLSTLIVQLKYHRHWGVGELLAERLLLRPHVRALIEEADLIVPVPLHWKRHYSRGYNQAAVVARRLARLPGQRRCFAQPARRVRDTESQTKLTSQKAREDNVRDAFCLKRPRLIEGKRIVVIDDVMTTGATIRSLARTLAKANPVSLSAVVVAVADPKRRDFQSI